MSCKGEKCECGKETQLNFVDSMKSFLDANKMEEVTHTDNGIFAEHLAVYIGLFGDLMSKTPYQEIATPEQASLYEVYVNEHMGKYVELLSDTVLRRVEDAKSE